MTGPGLVIVARVGLVRDGLVALLSPQVGAGPVRVAGSVPEAVSLVAAEEAGVLLVEAGLLGPGGVAEARALLPQVGIVVLAAEGAGAGMPACLAAGARGYVTTGSSGAELVRAVSVVRGGGVHVPAGLLADESGVAGPGAAAGRLTGRQRDVLRLMAEGRSTKDIARSMDLAVSTIKVHLAAVYRAVGARNRVEALCRAGLVPGGAVLS